MQRSTKKLPFWVTTVKESLPYISPLMEGRWTSFNKTQFLPLLEAVLKWDSILGGTSDDITNLLDNETMSCSSREETSEISCGDVKLGRKSTLGF